MAVEYVKNKFAAVADPGSLLETLFAEAPVAFAIAHVDGHCVTVNRAYRELFGAAPPATYSLFTDELMLAQGLVPHVQRAFQGEPVVVPAFWYDASELERRGRENQDDARAREALLPQLDGRRIAIELSMSPLRDRDGVVRHIALCYKDVTAAHELACERGLLRTLFEVAPDAIITYDLRTGRLDDANDNAVRLFGHSRQVLLELGLADLFPARQPDGRHSADVIAEHVDRAMRGEPLKLEWMHRTASGDELPCEVQLVRVPAGGRSLCRVSIVDLRERKQMESEREHVRQLEEQNLRTLEANRLKSEFLAAMSHELRTPLNTIIGFSELIFYDRVAHDSPEHHEFMGDILASGRHLLQLINDVLDLAKVEAGKLEFRPEPVVVESVIAEVTSVLRTLSLQKRIRVQVEADRSIEVIVIDPARFKQVLYNYLSNALKFTPEGGSIVVRTCPESPDSFRLEVEDSGIGIAPEQIQRLFVEVEQLGTAAAAGARKPARSGLGLVLTRRIVEAQGGTVGVRSSLGQGSVFHAVLPRETPAILAR
ncbi:MAG TPA: ATP-binding protein [Kofleriaceae bacterium]|nr:ATP-binding protein [Kofleriaceae bacterium]